MAPNIGDIIEITGVLPEDPNPIPIGSRGEVTDVSNVGTPFEQYRVKWDNNISGLMLLPGDPFKVVGNATS